MSAVADRAEKRQGTKWTWAGAGATVSELRALLPLDVLADSGAEISAREHLERIAAASSYLDKRTDLRLTGEPLTAEDLRRIAEAK